MAKDIRECLLEQARKFHQWQEITYPGKTTEEIGGVWEVDYPAWNDIFDAFCHVLPFLLIPIGRASAPIAAGAFVHTHNLEDITEELCRQYVAAFRDGRGA